MLVLFVCCIKCSMQVQKFPLATLVRSQYALRPQSESNLQSIWNEPANNLEKCSWFIYKSIRKKHIVKTV